MRPNRASLFKQISRAPPRSACGQPQGAPTGAGADGQVRWIGPSGFDLDNQQEAFRQLNALVLASFPQWMHKRCCDSIVE